MPKPRPVKVYSHSNTFLPWFVLDAIGERPWVRQAPLYVTAHTKKDALALCESAGIYRPDLRVEDVVNHPSTDGRALSAAGLLDEPGAVYAFMWQHIPGSPVVRVLGRGVAVVAATWQDAPVPPDAPKWQRGERIVVPVRADAE